MLICKHWGHKDEHTAVVPDPLSRVNTSEEHRGQEASRVTWERPDKTCSSISSPSSRASVDDEQLDLGVITQGGSALPENHRDLVKQDLK